MPVSSPRGTAGLAGLVGLAGAGALVLSGRKRRDYSAANGSASAADTYR
ncbi:MAG: hypothetical protein WC796_02375 [Candidatus Pacearchaeota archaeon]|jgi:hypothetical protein